MPRVIVVTQQHHLVLSHTQTSYNAMRCCYTTTSSGHVTQTDVIQCSALLLCNNIMWSCRTNRRHTMQCVVVVTQQHHLVMSHKQTSYNAVCCCYTTSSGPVAQTDVIQCSAHCCYTTTSSGPVAQTASYSAMRCCYTTTSSGPVTQTDVIQCYVLPYICVHDSHCHLVTNSSFRPPSRAVSHSHTHMHGYTHMHGCTQTHTHTHLNSNAYQ